MTMDKEYLQKMAEEVHKHLPDNHGFILFAFPFDKQGDGRMSYVANCTRESAITALKEYLFAMGEHEDWMKHIE